MRGSRGPLAQYGHGRQSDPFRHIGIGRDWLRPERRDVRFPDFDRHGGGDLRPSSAGGRPSDGTEFWNTTSSPARAGDVLVIYCTGLGPVSPAVAAGTAAPALPLSGTVDTVMVGGIAAQAPFAGLAPGFSGLYQVNGVAPSGVAPGPAVTVAIQ